MRKSHYVFIVVCALLMFAFYPLEFEAHHDYEYRIGAAFGVLIIPSIIYGVYLLVTRKRSTKKN